MAEVRWPAGDLSANSTRAADLSANSTSVAGARKVVTGIFRTFDSRGDGMFSCAALANVLRAVDTGAAMSDKEIERLLKAIDTDKSGWIHYEAFCDCIFGSMAPTSSLSMTAPGGTLSASGTALGGDPPSAEILAAGKLEAGDKHEAISPVTCSTAPGEGSSRCVSEELEEMEPSPERSGARLPSYAGLNPLLALELAAIDGDTGEPDIATERIPRTPSTARTRGSSKQGPDTRRPSLEAPDNECQDGEVTGCPSLAASMSSVAMTCPATSSSAGPPWGRAEGQATVALVSCAQDANEMFRSYMEDGQKIIDPFLVPENGQEGRWGFFAVYDGHGGRQAVDYCEERLHDIVLAELRSLGPEDRDVNRALRGAFEKVDGELAMHGAWRTGCTATVALVHRTATAATLYVANVGDSRAVLYGSVGARRISNDHRASDPAEAARIAEEGGMVRHGRVGGQLIVSRSLGDHHLKGCGVSCVPEVKECDVGSDRALVIASDGLWDGLQDEEAGAVVDRCVEQAVQKGGGEKAVADFLREAAARDLVEGAKERGSRDNILALVIFF